MENDTLLNILRSLRNESNSAPTVDPFITEATKNIDRVVSPILYVIGFPGNILSFIVWQQPRMRHSSGQYLAVLALADLLFLVIHVLFELHKVWGVAVFDAPVVCEGLPLVYTATQYLSPLLVLGFTAERLISVCFPMKRQTLCTKKRAQYATAGLAILSLLLAAIQGYFYTYNSKLRFCMFRAEAGEGGQRSLWSVWTWITEMLIFLCVPILILIFNMIIIKVIRDVKKEATRLVEFESDGKVHVQTTTYTLLVVSFFVIITSLPVSIVYVLLSSYFPTSGQPTPGFDRYMLAKTIVEEIGIVHFACKFYLFLIAERLFREEFKCLVRKMFCRSRNAFDYSPQTENTNHTEATEMAGSPRPDETNI